MTPQQQAAEILEDATALIDRAEHSPESIRENELRRGFWYLQQLVRDPRLQKAS